MGGEQNSFNNGDEDEDHASAGTSKRYGEIEEIIDVVERGFHEFENFGILQNPPLDHYFSFKKAYNSKNTVIEKIKGEWEVLRLHLTKSSIYVRVYEERPDLMRAIIIGPEGTPYHHGLFCFDIRLPANFPTQPPELFYRSYDHYLNPNLNRNGRFNLAALNGNKGLINFRRNSHPMPMTTWQILTTMKDSIFTKENGGGYDKQVLKQTSEIMLCALVCPPQDFEVFVYGYFRTKAHQILMNYKTHLVLDETTTRLFFKLVRAFEANGTYCQHHYNKGSYHLALLQDMLQDHKMPSTVPVMFS